MNAEYPSIEAILPHTGAIILLSRVLHHSPELTECEAHVGTSCVLASPDGSVPGFVSLEYMAQTIGAHAGLEARSRGEDVRVGFVLGSRRMTIEVDRFLPGSILKIRAKKLWMDEQMGMFECEILGADGDRLAYGGLNVYQPKELPNRGETPGRPLTGS